MLLIKPRANNFQQIESLKLAFEGVNIAFSVSNNDDVLENAIAILSLLIHDEITLISSELKQIPSFASFPFVYFIIHQKTVFIENAPSLPQAAYARME